MVPGPAVGSGPGFIWRRPPALAGTTTQVSRTVNGAIVPATYESHSWMAPTFRAAIACVAADRNMIEKTRLASGNLGTEVRRIIRRAGAEVWPKLFQNLRMSRQTELQNSFPTHVVCKWLGNSAQVAQKHYLKVTAEHFEQAVGGWKSAANALQQNAAQGCKALKTSEQAIAVTRSPATRNSFPQVYAESCEWTILDDNTLKKAGKNSLSAECAANALRQLSECPFLLDLVELWEDVPIEIRNSIISAYESTDREPGVKRLWKD